MLFDVETKYDADHAWPSFFDAEEGSIEFREDHSHGMTRGDPEFVARHLREYAVAVKSNIPDDQEISGLSQDKHSDMSAQSIR